MPLFEKENRIDASFEDVWSFHSDIEGLTAITPGWLNLTVEKITGPDGDPDPSVLEEGTTIEMSLRPLGFPVMSWKSRIIDREQNPESAYFVDEMTEGPFKKWIHTHSFRVEGGETVINDRVEFSPSLRMGGVLGSPFVKLNLAIMFRYRHRKTKKLLE